MSNHPTHSITIIKGHKPSHQDNPVVFSMNSLYLASPTRSSRTPNWTSDPTDDLGIIIFDYWIHIYIYICMYLNGIYFCLNYDLIYMILDNLIMFWLCYLAIGGYSLVFWYLANGGSWRLYLGNSLSRGMKMIFGNKFRYGTCLVTSFSYPFGNNVYFAD